MKNTVDAPKILVVDDEEALRIGVTSFLEDRGYDIYEAENGKAGLEVFEKENPSVILVDLRMPEKSGLEMLREVTAKSPDTPIIVISGAGLISDAIEALHLGAWDYLMKPIPDMMVLDHAIKNALDKASLIKENRRYRENLEEEVRKRTAELEKANSSLRREIEIGKITKDRLAESEQMLDSILDSVPDIIYRLDPDGRIIFISNAIRKYGYSPEDLINTYLVDIIHPDDIKKTEFRVDERRTGKRRTHNMEARIIPAFRDDADDFKSVIPVFLIEAEGLYKQVRDSVQFIGTQGIARDITLEKIASAALRESEERFRRLATHARDIIFRLSLPSGKCEFMSPAIKDVTGYTTDDLNSDLFKLLEKCIKKTWLKDFYIEWQNLIDGNPSPVLEYPIISKDGQEKWLYHRNFMIRGEKGEPVALEGIITDLTERKNLEQQLRKAQKMEAIGTLAGGIAHDFNNILSAIIGNTELIRMLVSEDDPLQSKTGNILKASHRARDLIMQILAFSRQSEKELGPLRITNIVNETIKLLEASLPKTIEIRKDISKKNLTVMADPTHIHQIVMNLCTNAHHAMLETGGILNIAVKEENCVNFGSDSRKTRPEKWVRLDVEDTGHGINTEIIDKIFDPYFTTKEKSQGTGLGLSVVHGIVTSLDGFIQVRNNPGSGTTFSVFLPLLETPEDEARSEKKDFTPVFGKERILLVDDESMILQANDEILKKLGYEVVSTENPETALLMFEKDPYYFDLVLTDMTMPKLTGENLAKKLMSVRPDIPIILTTGYSELISPEKARGIGIKDFLMKPLTMDLLSSSIRRILRSKDEGKTKLP